MIHLFDVARVCQTEKRKEDKRNIASPHNSVPVSILKVKGTLADYIHDFAILENTYISGMQHGPTGVDGEIS